MSGHRARVSSNRIRSSSRASAVPRQKMSPARAERLVLGCAGDVEAVRIFEALLVPVRRDVPHDHLFALANGLTRELRVAGRGAPEVVEGREHPQRILDQAWDQRRVVEDELALVRISSSARIPEQ